MLEVELLKQRGRGDETDKDDGVTEVKAFHGCRALAKRQPQEKWKGVKHDKIPIPMRAEDVGYKGGIEHQQTEDSLQRKEGHIGDMS